MGCGASRVDLGAPIVRTPADLQREPTHVTAIVYDWLRIEDLDVWNSNFCKQEADFVPVPVVAETQESKTQTTKSA